MTWTVERLNALKQAYSMGALRVSFDGRSTEYRSLDDMKRLITEGESALGVEPANKKRPRGRFFLTEKGL